MSVSWLTDEVRDKLKRIQLVALDVDGVLTDGKLMFDSQGNEYKAFNVLDGYGIKSIQALSIQVAIVTGRESSIVSRRAAELGIDHVVQGCSDKGTALQQLKNSLDLDSSQCVFIGDDEPDLAAMNEVALKVAPLNAVDSVKDIANIHLTRAGGDGAVREFCDALILANRGYSS